MKNMLKGTKNNFNLSRKWFDFQSDNPEVSTTNHCALFFYIIDLWNRLGDTNKFGLPTLETMKNTGIKNRKTYFKCFEDLVRWGFIKIIQRSSNQYKSTVISINDPGKKNGLSSLDLSHIRGKFSEPVKKKPEKRVVKYPEKAEFIQYAMDYFAKMYNRPGTEIKVSASAKFDAWSESGWTDGYGKKILNWKLKVHTTVPHLKREKITGVPDAVKLSGDITKSQIR